MSRMLNISPLVAVVAIVLINFPVSANYSVGPCTGNWPIEQGRGITAIPPPSNAHNMPPRYWLDNRGTSAGVWLYEETNLISGLQRGDSGLARTDTCVDDPLLTPDNLLL